MTINEITLSNSERFSLDVIRIKKDHNCTTIEAIVEFCEINQCEYQDVINANLIDRNLKELIWEDAVKQRQVKPEFVVKTTNIFQPE
jgi:hypothetical protein